MQTPSTSRFSRPSVPSTGAVAGSAVRANPGTIKDDDNLTQRYKTLKTIGDELQQQRLKRQFDLDQTEKSIAHYQHQAAEEFGVNSLEELIAFIEQQTAADQAALDAYEAAQQAEMALQASVDAALTVLDQPVQG